MMLRWKQNEAEHFLMTIARKLKPILGDLFITTSLRLHPSSAHQQDLAACCCCCCLLSLSLLLVLPSTRQIIRAKTFESDDNCNSHYMY
eukprot:5213228-Amphidinium_carterae.1